MVRHRIRNKARPLRVDVAVAGAALAVCEETLGNHQVKLILGSRHGDIEQPAFLLYFLEPVARSDGRHPSTVLSRKTAAHSCPLAEWRVERIR